MATPVPHTNDDLDELIIDIAVLIAEELDLTHLLGGHHRPVEGCARCERLRPVPGPLGGIRNPERIPRMLTQGGPDPAQLV